MVSSYREVAVWYVDYGVVGAEVSEGSDHDGAVLCRALAGTIAFEEGSNVVP